MSERVACPFCNTEVELEYLGGMSFGSGGLVGAMPTQEGTCTECEASVCGEPTLTKAGFFEVVISAHKVVTTEHAVIHHVNDIKSYTIREGVRVQ